MGCFRCGRGGEGERGDADGDRLDAGVGEEGGELGELEGILVDGGGIGGEGGEAEDGVEGGGATRSDEFDRV